MSLVQFVCLQESCGLVSQHKHDTLQRAKDKLRSIIIKLDSIYRSDHLYQSIEFAVGSRPWNGTAIAKETSFRPGVGGIPYKLFKTDFN